MVTEKQYKRYLQKRVKKNNIVLDVFENRDINKKSGQGEKCDDNEQKGWGVKTERKSFLTANVESNLHRQITQEAARNKKSFSSQIQEYKNMLIVLEGTVNELRSRINKQEMN